MQAWSDKQRAQGKAVAFVPTMGYLHEGHLSLLEIAKKEGDSLILSIFVNPTQFGPNEDLESYPRNLDADLEKAEKAGVDVVFVPQESTLYQENYQSYVSLERLPNHLCGLSRPVFFRGVATVVTQLFNITRPDIAVFGEKDFQQLAVIRQMVADLKFGIKIIGAPIKREADGLAMSSRNAYLKPEQRDAALTLSRSLAAAKEMVAEGERRVAVIREKAREIFAEHPEVEIDYIELCDPVTIDSVESINGDTLMALAVNLAGIRLIDNTVLVP